MPGPADPERLAANVAVSDERDAPRSLKEVEDEVHRRSGGDEPEEDKTTETKTPETAASSPQATVEPARPRHKGDR